MVADLKSRVRAAEKVRDRYAGREPGPAVAWLYVAFAPGYGSLLNPPFLLYGVLSIPRCVFFHTHTIQYEYWEGCSS